MRLLEERHPGENWLLWKIGNWTTINVERVRSWAWAWGNEYNGKFQRWGFTWRTADGCTYAPEALFFNAAWFARYVYPFGVFVQIRWSGRSDRKAYLHIGIGYKLNGRFGFLLRVQSDDSSTDGAWSGVANENVSTRGWQFGPK
jgi:hypothetical protein